LPCGEVREAVERLNAQGRVHEISEPQERMRDTEIALDILRVFALVAERHQYPDNMGYGSQFEAIVRAWRPALVLAGGNE
jgi:hypothetical protein